ncbi:hypothetical protein Trydic_g54 [Trypoxylus dichotomus]
MITPSIEIWTILTAMDPAKIDSRCRNLLKYMRDNTTLQIIDDHVTDKIRVKGGVRQGERISPKLFSLALEDAFKKLNWYEKGVNIDGRYINYLCFADDIVLISTNPEELQDMIDELRTTSKEVGPFYKYRKNKSVVAGQHNI